jgi:hypothetical protein
MLDIGARGQSPHRSRVRTGADSACSPSSQGSREPGVASTETSVVGFASTQAADGRVFRDARRQRVALARGVRPGLLRSTNDSRFGEPTRRRVGPSGHGAARRQWNLASRRMQGAEDGFRVSSSYLGTHRRLGRGTGEYAAHAHSRDLLGGVPGRFSCPCVGPCREQQHRPLTLRCKAR